MFKFLLYKIGQYIAIILPLKFTYKLAVFLADLYRLYFCSDRMAIENNLRVIFPQSDDIVIKTYVRDIFRNFAKYIADFFRFTVLDKDYVKNNIVIEGLDIVDEALGKSNGVIVVAAHIGNWELAGVTMALLGYPIACVALRHRYKPTDRLFIRQRECKGMSVIPLGNAAFRCLQALRRNKMLALVGDRDFTQAGISIDFFGKPTIIPRGPAALSLKTKAPIIIGTMVREDNDKFRFIFEGPVEIEQSSDEEKDIIALTKRYIAILEKYIRRYPRQWLMFRRFWEPAKIDACE